MSVRVVIDPCAAWAILDHHLRRKDGLELDRVSGLLFGITANQTVEVRQTLPGRENEFVETFMKTNPGAAVGWYVTLPHPDDMEVMKALSSNIDNAIYVVVDMPTAESPQLAFRAYRSLKVTLTTSLEDTKNVFSELPCTVEPLDGATSIAVDTFANLRFPEVAQQAQPAVVPSTADPSDVYAELRQMRKNLDAVKTYCDDVLAGKQAPNKALGRQLAALFTSTRAASEVPSAVVGEKLEDALMLIYISKILEKQVEELQASMARRS
jgi:hypothetical protein